MALETCSKCGMTKDGTNRSYCKACFNAYSRERTAQGRRKPPSSPRESCAKCGLTPKDGSHYSYCKACFANYVKAKYVPKPIKRTAPEVLRQHERERALRSYYRHREAHKARQKTPEYRAKQRARWAQLDPEYRTTLNRSQQQRRRCEDKGVPFEEYVDPLVVLEAEDGVCGVCREDVDPSAFEIDHVIPLRRGGPHSYANVQVVHPTCNRRKGLKVLL